jgi:hypothetical protein
LEEWRLERGEFIKQVDTFNCEQIACMKILEIYNLTTSYYVNLAYNMNSIRSFVISEWTQLVAQCNNDLILGVRECIPLLEPWPEDGETITVPRRSYPTIDVAVACEDIPTRNLYAVTQHLLTRRNFILLTSLSGF